jgi:hypothetical protein
MRGTVLGVALVLGSTLTQSRADDTALVEHCIRIVHAQDPYSRFDAYVVARDKSIEIIGTKLDRFRFEKCLEQGGLGRVSHDDR